MEGVPSLYILFFRYHRPGFPQRIDPRTAELAVGKYALMDGMGMSNEMLRPRPKITLRILQDLCVILV
jgi:hypothetical protein